MWPTHSGRFLFKVSSLLEVELVVERNLFDIRNDRCASCGLGPLLSELQRGDLVAVLLGQQEASFGKGNAVIGEFPLGLIQFKEPLTLWTGIFRSVRLEQRKILSS